MAKFSALAIMLQSSRKSPKDKNGAADTKESKDIKVTRHITGRIRVAIPDPIVATKGYDHRAAVYRLTTALPKKWRYDRCT